MIRLYVTQPLGKGQSVALSREQAHYLFAVMRKGVGAELLLFNGVDGEWRGTVIESGKRGGAVGIDAQTQPQRNPPDLWLLFAPIKKARTDFIVEKAVELGAARICPVQTQFTNSERIRRDRLQAHAVEAAEQCGATCVPEVADLVKLPALLAKWPAERHLIFCDEAMAGAGMDLPQAKPPAAILIGPEGGFSGPERTMLRQLPNVRPIALGPRILRADTAAVAALTLWQAAVGDWGAPP